MDKKNLHFDPVTHRFEAPKQSLGNILLRYGLPAVLAVILSLGIKYSLGKQLSNPKEIKLQAEKKELIDNYLTVQDRVIKIEASINELQCRDDNIYRSYYQMEPVSAALREAGIGGAEQYSNLHGYESSQVMIDLTRRIEMADVRLDLQSGSFTDLLSKAEYQKQLLDHKPSIQPISLQNFYWISSTFGYRTDPMSKRRAMHRGLDFAGRKGLNVYATGDGVVVRTKVSRTGFGQEVLIDHGFGYVTRYGHMNSILVQMGQEIKRGNIIGTLGSTGKSTGPHLHYEVRHYGRAMNPKYFYSEDLSPTEYSEIVGLAGPVDN
jgi:murein DD-endopeptidase MepM/ murein hydrolase activator NlpD